MSHRAIAAQAIRDNGIPTTEKDEYDHQETLSRCCGLFESDGGIGDVFRFGSNESEEEAKQELKDILSKIGKIDEDDSDFRHGEDAENTGTASGGREVNGDVSKEANKVLAPFVEDKIFTDEKEDAIAAESEEDGITDEGGRALTESPPVTTTTTGKADDAAASDAVIAEKDAATAFHTEEDAATAFQTEEDAVAEECGNTDNVATVIADAAPNAATTKVNGPDLKGELMVYAGENRTDVFFATPQQQHRSIIDTATKLEVANSGSSSCGVSDSIKDLVALARTALDSEFDTNRLLWKSPPPASLPPAGSGLEMTSLGSSDWEWEVEVVEASSNLDNKFSGVSGAGVDKFVREVEILSTITTTNDDGGGMKACNDSDMDEAANAVISSSLTKFVDSLDAELTDFTRIAATAGIATKMTEKEMIAKPTSSESMAAVDGDKNKEDSLKLVQQQFTGIKSPQHGPVPLQIIIPGALVHKESGHAAMLVTKHVRGYLARMKVARMMQNTRYTPIAEEAASAAVEDITDEVRDDDELAQRSSVRSGSNNDLTDMAGSNDNSSFTFSLSTFQDTDSDGEGLPLERAFHTNWSPTDIEMTTPLAQELLTSLFLGEEADGGNVLENGKCLNWLTVISDSEPEAINEDFGHINKESPLLAGAKVKENSLRDSPGHLFADNEGSDGSELFGGDPLGNKKLPKMMNICAMSCPRKVDECTGALGDCRDDIAISGSKGDDLSERNNVPRSVQVRSGDQMEERLDYSSDSASTHCYEIDNGNVIFPRTRTAQNQTTKEIGIQVGSNEMKAEKSRDLVGRITGLDATVNQKPLTKEIGIQVVFFDEMGTEKSRDLADRILAKSEHLQQSSEKISTLANGMLALEEKHNTSLSLLRRQLSILKGKHATVVTDKLAMEDGAKRTKKKNDDLSAQVLVLKGECEALMLQKVAAEAKVECLLRTNLAANAINAVAWIVTLLLMLALID